MIAEEHSAGQGASPVRPLSSDDIATAQARRLRASWYRNHARVVIVVIGVLCAVFAIWQSWRISEANALAEVRRVGAERLTLYASTVDGALDRYRYLPFVLALNPAVRALVSGNTDASRVNVYLETVNAQAGAAALFVMNIRGDTLASSNWSEPLSFVGQNYAFRPYFRRAMAGESGEFFAIGVTTGLPGYFMSAPIHSPSGIVGVAVVKVDLDRLQLDWSDGGENVIVRDENGIIFLSSQPGWKYHSLDPLGDAAMSQIRARRQYNNIPIQTLAFTRPRKDAPDLIRIAGEPFVEHAKPLKQAGWTMHYLTPMAPVRDQVLGVVTIVTVSSFLFIVFMLYLRERRERQRSREAAEEANALRLLSNQLQQEIEERKRTEDELRATQNDLVQAGKLAALGQMSAAIAHELNQPIAAIRTFVASGRRLLSLDRKDELDQNLGFVTDLTERMAAITGQLKTFARKSEGRNRPVPLDAPISAALALLDGQLRAAGVRVSSRCAEPVPTVMGDPVRIEQVLINLVRNSLDAMRDVDTPSLTIDLSVEENEAILTLADVGHGISPDVQTQLFDPFFTTKDVGEGVGLGLSISYGIIADMGGTIRAQNNPDGPGARFTIRLPIIQKEATS